MHGHPLKKGFELQGTSIADVMPTILYLMGVPVPSYVDGRVLSAAFSEEHLSLFPIHRVNTEYEPEVLERDGDDYSASEVAGVEERLKGLGYL